MLDKEHCESVKGKFTMLKSTVEREAREAYAAGLSPNEACTGWRTTTCVCHCHGPMEPTHEQSRPQSTKVQTGAADS